jgi:hypothetical protein
LDLDRIGNSYFNYHFNFDYDAIDWENYDFYWDLGNGTISTETSVPVDYTLDGYYCVSATVRREECISTNSEIKYVYPSRCYCMEDVFEPGFYDDHTLTSNENWDGVERKIRAQVIVPSGVTLNLHKCLLQFGTTGGITVEPGGTLIVSQTIMTSLNPGAPSCDGMWSGIEVHGQWGLTTAQQGKVQFINGGNIIENAHIGVLLGERNVDYVCNPHIDPELGPFNTSGSCGWVKAGDVEFVNNGTDIRFVKPIGNYQYNNPSAVKNCDFTCEVLLDECYRSSHPSHYGLVTSILGVSTLVNTRNPWAGGSNATQRSPQGIWMQKHRFNNNFDLNTLMNKEICVETYDSRYDVTRSHFYHAIYGLRIYNTLNTANNAHRIYNNTFDKIPGIAGSPGAHIYIQGGILDRIRDNKFGEQYSSQNLSNTGIYSTGASRFVIEENDFNRLKTGVFVGNSGTNSSDVRAGDSNVHDDWRGNNFYQCKTNIYTRGLNARLRLRCNNCENSNPSPTMHDVNFLNQGVLANQGTFSSTTPQQIWGAGNEFTDADAINPSPSSRYIKSNYAYRYVYHSDVKTTPVIYPGSVLNPQPLGLAKAVNTVACPVLSISFALPLNGIPAIEEILPIRPDILNEIDYLEQLRTNLKNNEDGGKTQQLLDDIYNHIPNGELKNKLIANSPLSDTVITALLIEYPLSHGNFKNVMEINMPVSPAVEPYLFARLETLPQGIRQQLKPLQSFNPNVNTVSSTTRYIDYLTQERELLVNEILMIFTDTAYYNPEYIKLILAAENNLQFDMNLAAFLIDEGNYSDAIQIINDIEPVNKETSDWIDYHQILLSLFNNNKTIYQMDSTQLAFITDLAYACPSNYTTANAQAVLHMLFGTEFEECEEMLNRGSFSLIKDVVFTIPETNAWVEDNFPNPFTDETLINYYLPEESTGSIVVTDMYGREIAFFNLASGENTLNVKSDAWAPGVYSYSFIVDGKSLEHKKMIITQ